MEWISSLFFSQSVAQSVIVLASVIALGLFFSKIKVANVSFGVTWVLFAGILFSHFGVEVNPVVLHFVKEFGLILFIYSIGLQVGPGFFSSLKKGGLRLNMLALTVVLTGVLIALAIHFFSGTPMPAIVGVLSGAVTNTPGLGAAQQTFMDMKGYLDPNLALGYAVAYPLGVVGIIISLLFVRFVFRVNMNEEKLKNEKSGVDNLNETLKFSVLIDNPSIDGKLISQVKRLVDKDFIISRISDGKNVKIAGANSILHKGDSVLVITNVANKESVVAFLGREVVRKDEFWSIPDLNVLPRRILVTKESVNGKTLSQLKLGKAFGITVTRINRAGVDLLARPDASLQIGDRLIVVGTKDSVDAAADLLGNSMHKLLEPNLTSIFIGIATGIAIGSVPVFLPGIPQPVKLGLAGGPLIVAILISRFGPRMGLVTYTTTSANLMLREVGISLFLACVGLGAGGNFVETIVEGPGINWILYGVIITMVPLMLVGFIARVRFKMDYLTIMGLLAGSTTDPPALAYAGACAGNDQPAVSYATVYPLTMFLRVLSAQLLILLF